MCRLAQGMPPHRHTVRETGVKFPGHAPISNDPTISQNHVFRQSLVLLLIAVYLVGVLGQHLVGRRLIAATEKVWLKIPLARSIYAATKQVMEALSQPQGTAFKSVVLVEFPAPGLTAVGFLTGYIHDNAGRKYAKVLIPTTPNPTTGFLELVPAEKVTVTNLAVEEAFRMIISGGIVSPKDLFTPKAETGAQ
jgi:uncharacterized membrane protein